MHVSMMCDSVCYVRVDAAQLPTGLAENLRKLEQILANLNKREQI